MVEKQFEKAEQALLKSSKYEALAWRNKKLKNSA
jgi:hypothetical protein